MLTLSLKMESFEPSGDGAFSTAIIPRRDPACFPWQKLEEQW